MRRWLPLIVVMAACEGNATTAPSPSPTPTPVPVPAQPRFAYTGRVVSTQSGGPVPDALVALDTLAPFQADATGSFTVEAAKTPLRAVISAPGYITRETSVSAGHPLTVDLIAIAAPFSSIFYGQLVRNMLESPAPDIVRTLPAAPSFYLQTTGLSGGNVTRLIAAAREIVPAMTGGRFEVTTFETGSEARPERPGWIVVEVVQEPQSTLCGHAFIGETSGHIWLNTVSTETTFCADRSNGDTIARPLFQHEIGHALGFRHIDVPGSLMKSAGWLPSTVLTDSERYHATIAYRRQAGNRDPDIDAATVTPLSARSTVMVAD